MKLCSLQMAGEVNVSDYGSSLIDVLVVDREFTGVWSTLTWNKMTVSVELFAHG